MTTANYHSVPATCPSCRYRFVAPVLSIVDPEQSPESKALLLSGRLNIAACPQCGHAGMLRVPLVYHDASQELLLSYVPEELGASEEERQRILGDLTNRVISNLPSEKRKGYLLRPQTFLRLERLVEAILAADGITPEMLEAQRARVGLLERLLQARDQDSMRAIIQENDADVDYEFFQLLTLNLEMAQGEDESELAQQLESVRQTALAWTTKGRELEARRSAIEELGEEVSREGLLEKLVEAALAGESLKVETMVTLARPAIDYVFYQQLTARIEAAQGGGEQELVETLTKLRSTVLDLTDQVDAQAEAATQRASALLEQILDAEDPEKEIRASRDQLDELFFGILMAHLEAAEKAGQEEEVARLRQVVDVVLQLVQESQPPEVRFVNELLSAEYPAGTQALLEGRRDLVTDGLLEVMTLIAQDLETRDQSELAESLGKIREQAAALRAGSDVESG